MRNVNKKFKIMIWTIIKYLLLAALLYVVYFCVNAQLEKKYYEKQGVKFCPYFPLVTDTLRIIR